MPGGSEKARFVLFCLILVAGLGLALVPSLRAFLAPERLREMVASSGSLALGVYAVAAVALPFLWVPRSALILLGGVLFGPCLGATVAYGTSIIEAVLFFLLARYFARAYVARLLERRGVATDRVSPTELGWLVFLARLCPLAHAGVTSYLAGMSPMPLGRFTVATALGFLPNSIAWAVLGDAMVGSFGAVQACLAATYLVASSAATLVYMKRLYSKVRRRSA